MNKKEAWKLIWKHVFGYRPRVFNRTCRNRMFYYLNLQRAGYQGEPTEKMDRENAEVDWALAVLGVKL